MSLQGTKISRFLKAIITAVCIGLLAAACGGSSDNVEIDGTTAHLDYHARINLGNNSALKAVVHTLGKKVYNIAKKHEEVEEVEVSLYYIDLQDKYGNDIPVEEAHDSTFIIDDLDEVRKYSDGLQYAMEYEVQNAMHVISGNYSYLWQ